MIEKHVTISKSDIEAIGKLKGHTVFDMIEVDGVEYPALTLAFKGFAGASVAPDHKTFAGVYRFEKSTEVGTAETMSAKSLPCWSGAPVAQKFTKRTPLEKPLTEKHDDG